MEPWLRELFTWLPSGGLYYLLIGMIAFGESLVAVGLLLPGSTICVGAGFFALHGQGEILPLILAAAAGAFLGDFTSFLLGARFGISLLRQPMLRKHLDNILQAEQFFREHGGKSVFFGRFFGPIRGIVPFVAGSSRMHAGSFLGFAVTSALLWGLGYPGLGYLAGASWQNVQRWSLRLSLLIGLALACVIVTVLVRRKLK